MLIRLGVAGSNFSHKFYLRPPGLRAFSLDTKAYLGQRVERIAESVDFEDDFEYLQGRLTEREILHKFWQLNNEQITVTPPSLALTPISKDQLFIDIEGIVSYDRANSKSRYFLN